MDGDIDIFINEYLVKGLSQFIVYLSACAIATSKIIASPISRAFLFTLSSFLIKPITPVVTGTAATK
jgi:hypothetical protein